MKSLIYGLIYGLVVCSLCYSNILLAGDSNQGPACPTQVSTALQLHGVLTNPACRGHVVNLAQGTFLPALPTSGDPRDRTFNVAVSNLTLSGQGPGKTILSGDIGVPGVNADNTRHVMTVLSAGNGLTLKNLTISDGYSDLPNPDDGTSGIGQGAGIYIEKANVSFANVAIQNNTLFVTNPQPPSDPRIAGGAGLFARGSQIAISNSVIANNQAVAGGGFTVVGSVSTTTVFQIPPSAVLANHGKNGSLIITNTKIINNNGVSDSGGGSALGLDNFQLINSVISNNASPGGVGGGIVALNNIQNTLNNSNFKANQANAYAGAVLELVNVPFNDVMQSGAFNSTVNNCTFNNNIALNSDGAPGIGAGLTIEQYFGNADVYQANINNTQFVGNYADVEGGGMYIQNAQTTLQNLNFIKNTSVSGGGVLAGFSAVIPKIQNVTFIDNSAINSDIFGPADAGAFILAANSQILSMQNVLFLQNLSQASGGALKLAYDDPTLPPSSIGNVKNAAFIGNTASISGNAIFCDNNQTIGPFINTLFGVNQTIVGCTINP